MLLQAIAKLDTIIAQPDASPGTTQLLHTSLLQALQHDTLAVALAAAQTRALSRLPADQLLPALTVFLQRSTAAALSLHGQSTSGPEQAHAGQTSSQTSSQTASTLGLEVTKQALACVSAVAHRDAAHVNTATGLLLEYVLAGEHGFKVAAAAVAECQQQHQLHDLLGALQRSNLSLHADHGAEKSGVSDHPTPQTHKHKKSKKRGQETLLGPAADITAQAAVDGAAGSHKMPSELGLNRAVVAALADAIVSSTGTEMVDSLVEVMHAAGPRCRLLSLLALNRAVKLLSQAGQGTGQSTALQATKSVKGQTPSKVQDAAPSSTEQRGSLLGQLVNALLAQLIDQMSHIPQSKSTPSSDLSDPAAAAASSGLTGTHQQTVPANGSSLSPVDWQASAQQWVDSEGLPAYGHVKQLSSVNNSNQLELTVLHTALHLALATTPQHAVAAAVTNPTQIFIKIAQHTASADQLSAVLPHLHLLVCSAAHGSELEFLSQFFGLPVELCNERVQVAALMVLQQNAKDGGSFITDGSDTPTSSKPHWFLRVLAAASSQSSAVRTAAVQVLGALVPVLQQQGSQPLGAAGLTHQQAAELCAVLDSQRAVLESNANAVASILRSALQPAALVPDVTAAGLATPGTRNRRSKTRSEAGNSSTATPASAQPSSSAAVALSPEAAAAVLDYFLQQLPDLVDVASLVAGGLVTAVLQHVTPVSERFAASACKLLKQLLAHMRQPSGITISSHSTVSPERASALVEQLHTSLAAQLLPATPVLSTNPPTEDLLQCLSTVLVSAADRTEASKVRGGKRSSKSAAKAVAAPALRSAAMQLLTPAFYQLLPSNPQSKFFWAVVLTSASDPDADCRAVARAALHNLPIAAANLAPPLGQLTAHGHAATATAVTLSATANPAQPAAVKATPPGKRARTQTPATGLKTPTAAAAATAKVDESADVDMADVDLAAGSSPVTVQRSVHSVAADFNVAVAVLELLQWKTDVVDAGSLVTPVQQLVQVLLPLLGSIAVAHEESVADLDDDDDDIVSFEPDVNDASDGGVDDLGITRQDRTMIQGSNNSLLQQAVRPSTAGYAVQLALMALQRLAEAVETDEQLPGSGVEAGFDVPLVLQCAQQAPDSAVSNAALSLLGVLAKRSPQAMLQHVLQVIVWT